MSVSRRRDDSGFTLIELMVVIAILGVIAIPLGNFVASGFKYFVTTQTRLADSHDVQITTAYFSQDAANSGLRDYSVDPATGTPAQSIWIARPSGTYCGSGVSGTLLVLLKWNDISATLSGGATTTSVTTDSAAYIVSSGVLHRIFCLGGNTTTSNATLAHNFLSPDSGNPSPVTCASATGVVTPCTNSTPPAIINFELSIKGPSDTTAWNPVLTANRRQS